ncbi:MAG: hypothetical protein KAI17_21045, partial [Thiotrichaceae bacterium]|nr:hypothetical protein [Thiotrichaceae bacterium]
AWTRDYAAKERAEDFAFLKTKAKAFEELSSEQKAKLVSTVKPVMKEFAKEQLGDQYKELWNLLEQSK